MYISLFSCWYILKEFGWLWAHIGGRPTPYGPTAPSQAMAILPNTSKSNINPWITSVFLSMARDESTWFDGRICHQTDVTSQIGQHLSTLYEGKRSHTRGGGPTSHREVGRPHPSRSTTPFHSTALVHGGMQWSTSVEHPSPWFEVGLILWLMKDVTWIHGSTSIHL